MAVRFRRFDGHRVSRAWDEVLTAARRDGVSFHLNSGKRTLREQGQLYRLNMRSPGVPRPGRPVTAFPSPLAPHIRTGRIDHAIDVNDENLFDQGGGFERLQDWAAKHNVTIRRTVASEAWHGEASAGDLRAFASRARRRRRLLKALETRNVSRKGVDLVAAFEGGQSRDGLFHPYRDPVGVWTIGYGHTEGVGPRTPAWSKTKARRMLRRELNEKYARAPRALNVPLNQSQFDALTSFVYNLGPGSIMPSTGIGKALREEKWQQAADQMLRWDRAAGHVLPGLTRRREAERRLFLSGREA